jgi:hypothetical protein
MHGREHVYLSVFAVGVGAGFGGDFAAASLTAALRLRPWNFAALLSRLCLHGPQNRRV